MYFSKKKQGRLGRILVRDRHVDKRKEERERERERE
jgi:hypothetical protein